MSTVKNKMQKIILVDDNLEIHNQVISFFSPKKFEVICFCCAHEALAASKETGLSWDVIITDFHFLKMTSLDFIAKIKELLPDIPIILSTPIEVADSAIKAIEKGAYDFIVKPIHFPQLQMVVNRALKLNSLQVNLLELKSHLKMINTTYGDIIARSPKFIKVLDLARRIATSSANIFISGESGTGKEVLVKFIHSESKENRGPLIAINCAAIPETLLESELFGHAKGAFTGAQAIKLGLFEEAQNGTLFLDEIGDLSLPLQAKLLRVLQEKKIRRVGENHDREINCRIISATHKDLSLEINGKRFREDLFFRLNVIPISIPPLRERHEDLLPLAESFLKKYALDNASKAKTFSKEAWSFILNNPWRGNVRELENAVERAVILSSTSEISLENLIPSNSGINATEIKKLVEHDENIFQMNCGYQLPRLDSMIQRYIEFAVKKNGGARDKTARDIGIDRKTLYKRFNKQDLSSFTHD